MCSLNYWQRRQINSSYKLQEARCTDVFWPIILRNVTHIDYWHGVVRCACVRNRRPVINNSAHCVARKCGFIPCRASRFLSCQKRSDRPWGWLSLLFRVYFGLFPRGYIGRGGKLTTSLHLVPKLRMSGCVPPLHHVFVACTFPTPITYATCLVYFFHPAINVLVLVLLLLLLL